MKKVGINEEDAYFLGQRYNLSTILTLFQEVSQVAGVKIDWNALVKKTTTGINSAREYQMLWKHLAYHHSLLDKIEEGAETLDDDSDLDLEIEVVPSIIDEALCDATTIVQLMLSCGTSRGLGSTKKTGLKAPLAEKEVDKEMLDTTPDKRPLPSSHGIAINTLQKRQTQPTGASTAPLTENELVDSSYPPKKKRKLWTKEEDNELIAAVLKFGEGNWVNILRANSKIDRTASQLSQRWSAIRKRDANLLAVSGNKLASSMQSERIATQMAISLALDTPKGGGAQSIGRTNSSRCPSLVPEALPVSSQPFNPHKPPSALAASQAIDSKFSNKCGTSSTSSTTHIATNSSIQAAALAAGGRIVTPSTAASLFGAAKSIKAVHVAPIRSTIPSCNSIKSSAVTTSTADMMSKSMPTVATTVRPSAKPVSSSCNVKPGGQVQSCSVELVNNVQKSGSDTISNEMEETKVETGISPFDAEEQLGQEVEWADDNELSKLLEFDIDSRIENESDNANDGSGLQR